MKKRLLEHVSFEHVAYALAIGALLAVFSVAFAERSPRASAETKFVEMSKSGLSIVPASCPSSTYPSNCTCRVTLSDSSITTAETARLTWNTADGGTLSVQQKNNRGLWVTVSKSTVASTGGRNVSPDKTTQYQLSGFTTRTNTFGGRDNRTTRSHTYAYNCSKILTVSACAGPTYSCVGDDLRRQNCDGSVTTTSCPDGCSNGACIGEPPPEDVSCPLGYVRVGGECVFAGCPSGYIRNSDGWCEAAQQCNATADCESGFICSGGMCLFGFAPGSSNGEPAGDISAKPSLVRTGRTSVIKWDSTGYDQCVVTENNPDISDAGEGWSGVTGEHQTSPIARRTQYTLTCDGEVIDKANVNILPVFIEL